MEKELSIKIDPQNAKVEEIELAAYQAQKFADELTRIARERRQQTAK